MKDPNENRPGFKEAKVGWIPEDWDMKPLGALGSFSKGKGIPNQEKRDDGYPCITYGDIYTKYGAATRQFSSFINEGATRDSIEVGMASLLFAGSGETLDEIGKCVAYVGKERAYAGGDIVIFVPSNANCVYLSYFINSDHCVRYRRRLGQGHSVVHIYATGLKTLNIVIPPLPEQQKIAEILSTWDEAIEQTRKLIDAKKRRKKGLMQQLLSGKKRLPGFAISEEYSSRRFFDIPSDWECPWMRDIAREQSERNGSGSDITVFACSKYHGFVPSEEYFGKRVFSEDTSNYKIVRRGWFGFPANHVEEGSIGLLYTHDMGIVSPIYVTFSVCDRVFPEYLYAVFKTETFRHIFSISTNASVDRRGSLRWREFGLIRVPLPSVEEQKAIVAVLKTADEEITHLETELKALEKQKHGLMQKLLTGTVRVTS